MKKYLMLVIVVLIGGLVLTGCGKKNDLKKYSGTYSLEYSKYVGDENNADDEEWTIVLKEDGTGTSNRDGESYEIEWSMDKDNIKLAEKFMNIKNDYNGTIKDNKLDIFNGDKDNDLTLEAVFIKK